ncbi:hypothetical protein MRB53_039703 [Persea americana]|nr:hypothetical protein MRB53_039703 [Persea americana]
MAFAGPFEPCGYDHGLVDLFVDGDPSLGLVYGSDADIIASGVLEVSSSPYSQYPKRTPAPVPFYDAKPSSNFPFTYTDVAHSRPHNPQMVIHRHYPNYPGDFSHLRHEPLPENNTPPTGGSSTSSSACSPRDTAHTPSSTQSSDGHDVPSLDDSQNFSDLSASGELLVLNHQGYASRLGAATGIPSSDLDMSFEGGAPSTQAAHQQPLQQTSNAAQYPSGNWLPANIPDSTFWQPTQQPSAEQVALTANSQFSLGDNAFQHEHGFISSTNTFQSDANGYSYPGYVMMPPNIPNPVQVAYEPRFQAQFHDHAGQPPRPTIVDQLPSHDWNVPLALHQVNIPVIAQAPQLQVASQTFTQPFQNSNSHLVPPRQYGFARPASDVPRRPEDSRLAARSDRFSPYPTQQSRMRVPEVDAPITVSTASTETLQRPLDIADSQLSSTSNSADASSSQLDVQREQPDLRASNSPDNRVSRIRGGRAKGQPLQEPKRAKSAKMRRIGACWRCVLQRDPVSARIHQCFV